MVSQYKDACETLQIIVVGFMGFKNFVPGCRVLPERYAVLMDCRSRIEFDA